MGHAAEDAGSNSKTKKQLAEPVINQINVLKALGKDSNKGGVNKTYAMDDIAHLAGIKDEKEVQRYLFILEGQKLVSPVPEGDFTSKIWTITKEGIRAMKMIASSDMMQN